MMPLLHNVLPIVVFSLKIIWSILCKRHFGVFSPLSGSMTNDLNLWRIWLTSPQCVSKHLLGATPLMLVLGKRLCCHYTLRRVSKTINNFTFRCAIVKRNNELAHGYKQLVAATEVAQTEFWVMTFIQLSHSENHIPHPPDPVMDETSALCPDNSQLVITLTIVEICTWPLI